MPCRRPVAPLGVELDRGIRDPRLPLTHDRPRSEGDDARIVIVGLDSEPRSDIRILGHIEEHRVAAGVLDSGECLESGHPIESPVCPGDPQDLFLCLHHLIFVGVRLLLF
jgi:hypothetical protein